MTQTEFDHYFITAGEITELTGCYPMQLLRARQSGALPNAIAVGRSFIWVREELEPHLALWYKHLAGKL